MSQSRAASQERNRRILLDVAREAFLRDGYRTTSLAALAREAGFTTGIVYSAFGSKVELALAVLRELQEEQIAELSLIVKEANNPDQLFGGVGRWATQAARSGRIRLDLELFLDSVDDPVVAEAQRARQRSAVEQAVEILRTNLPSHVVDDDAVLALAEALVDYTIGLSIRHTIDPSASPERFFDLVRPVLQAVNTQRRSSAS